MHHSHAHAHGGHTHAPDRSANRSRMALALGVNVAMVVAAVVVSGAIVFATGWDRVDPITGILLSVLIFVGSWRLISEPMNVLMEAAPAGVDVEEVGTAMATVEGVREVHDLHVWTVTSGFPALAAHVRVDPARDSDEVRHAHEHELADRFGIEHTTLQVMVEQLLEIEDRRPARE